MPTLSAYKRTANYSSVIISPPSPHPDDVLTEVFPNRDVKTANIFVAMDQKQQIARVKLGDFGISKVISNINSRMNSFVGTTGIY